MWNTKANASRTTRYRRTSICSNWSPKPIRAAASRPAFTAGLVFGVAVAWSLFQLWYASPLPFMLGFGVFGDTEARAFHLCFAFFLAFTAYPAFATAPRTHVPLYDWVLAALAIGSVLYLVVFYKEIAMRPGLPTRGDVIAAVIGIVLLLEASRRAEGPWMPVIGILALAYVFLGPYLPGLLAHKGSSLSRAASHFWLTSEGVFGVALGVSTNFIFLFVLFGALLEKAGAGNYFIQVAFSLLGQFRGGPAKAAVVSSGMTGMISGSSVANVVTTGTFTIPLMKRVGYPAVKAGAIECAAGVNGQLMPPVMGAAAFLMAEYVGITYAEVCKHALLPALLTYGALFYVVDLEAVKAGMTGLPRRKHNPLKETLIKAALTISSIVILSCAIYYGLGWTKGVFGEAASWIAGAIVVVAYIALLYNRAPASRSAVGRSDQGLCERPGLLRNGAHRPALHYPCRRPDLVSHDRGDVAGARRLLGRADNGRRSADPASDHGMVSRGAQAFRSLVAGRARIRRGARARRAQHDRRRHRDRDRGHSGRHGHAHRHRPRDDRDRRIPVRRLDRDHADPGRRHLHHPRLRLADHGELRRRRDADGAGRRAARRGKRSRRAADRGAYVRVLFRLDGGRVSAGGFSGLCGGGDCRRRSDESRLARHVVRIPHTACCHSSSSSIRRFC